MRFRTEQHLRRQRDFLAIREHGRRIHCGAFTFWCLDRKSPAATPAEVVINAPGVKRLGVVASTAAVGNAVQRNRAKRRLREIFRLHQAAVAENSDVLLTARKAVTTWQFSQLEKQFLEACRQVSPAADLKP